jgi:hypothetical protein
MPPICPHYDGVLPISARSGSLMRVWHKVSR